MDIAAQAAQIDSYLEGDARMFNEVDGWIRTVLKRHYPILQAEVEDLCQVVHVKLMANLKSNRFQHRSTLKTYVAGITHHTAIDGMRKIYRERAVRSGVEVHDDIDISTPYQSLVAMEEVELLRQVLLNAPPVCRELWRMSFFEKLSYEQIGRRLSIPQGTVKSRMWHCRRKALLLLERLKRLRR